VSKKMKVVMDTAGLGTKNYCADEDHQQFIRCDRRRLVELQDFWSLEILKYGQESRGTWNQK
jgi:hypothetical protein